MLYIQNRTNDMIESINTYLQNSDFKLIDTSELLYNESLNKKYSTDGIHLNDEGYRIYTNSIKKTIKIE